MNAIIKIGMFGVLWSHFTAHQENKNETEHLNYRIKLRGASFYIALKAY